ncbi:HYD1 signature containing ADP-ribosyltransferase family protein [Paenibacillus fonticola]|uniref:HYD1 signature containing ADP-ribosyltransferase family protein n=1 Tax=Paenibacillus fonticola TaxID=379896 RepID=UPI0023E3F759|nr:HYD1 signature containing ADP-ribosyltransferase family protein [Paenibacillus fonticola]
MPLCLFFYRNSQAISDKSGQEPDPASLITWVFEDGTFHPAAKITSEGHYSIVTDHLGTPVEMYDEHGERVWSCELDIYGNVRKFILKGDHNACPFRYPGQYEDVETGLYYNRLRYYSPHEGMYTQQDPIGLAGGIRLYGYVDDPIIWVDVFGLKKNKRQKEAKQTRCSDGGDTGKQSLYHYTNEKGANGIFDSNQLNPSLKANNPKDVRYGDGQYLSDIAPETKTPAQLAKQFINVPNKYKYTHYVEIDVSGLEVIKGRDGVFVIPNETALDLIGRIVRSGKVGGK